MVTNYFVGGAGVVGAGYGLITAYLNARDTLNKTHKLEGDLKRLTGGRAPDTVNRNNLSSDGPSLTMPELIDKSKRNAYKLIILNGIYWGCLSLAAAAAFKVNADCISPCLSTDAAEKSGCQPYNSLATFLLTCGSALLARKAAAPLWPRIQLSIMEKIPGITH